jgi:hypothetical protein
MTATTGHVSLCVALLLASCGKSAKPPVEDLHGRENLSAFSLGELRGTRDGDRLDAEAKFEDGSSTLTVTMRFAVGSPTRLESGRWEWIRDRRLASGTVAERSVMFLGGQDGPPSIGGRFDLLDLTGIAEYRITIPTTELKIKLPLKTDRIGPTELRSDRLGGKFVWQLYPPYAKHRLSPGVHLGRQAWLRSGDPFPFSPRTSDEVRTASRCIVWKLRSTNGLRYCSLII